MVGRILDVTLFTAERLRMALLAIAAIGLIKSAFFLIAPQPVDAGAERVVVPISPLPPAPAPV